jgi:hypothetical protein
MYKKCLSALILFSFILVYSGEVLSRKYVAAGPVQNFTIQELDRLKQLKPVFRDNLLYSLDRKNASILASNYPNAAQIFSSGNFANRVQLSEFHPDDSIARYTIFSAYGFLGDSPVSFSVKVNRVFDAYLSPLDNPGNKEITNTTNLINIKYINDEFIRQTEGRSFTRITHNLGSLVLFLNAVQGVDIADLSVDEKKNLSYSLLSKFIYKKLKKNIVVYADTVLDVEDAVQLNRLLQKEIFNYLGIDPKKLPEIYEVQEFMSQNNWLENIKMVPLAVRIAKGDPSIVIINFSNNPYKIRSTGIDSDSDIGDVMSDDESQDSSSSSSSSYQSSDSEDSFEGEGETLE